MGIQMLSIVMPVYNGEKTVARAIESMITQTYSDFEFIIIDDCSRDQTSQILQNFQAKDRRIKILRNQTNLGIAASLNKGILEARGDWIVRMDDDDESLPDRIAKQVKFIQTNPDLDIFGGKAIFQNRDGEVNKNYFPEWPPILQEDIETFIYTTSPLIHPSVCMRKQRIQDIGLYNKDFSGAEDYELWVRAWRRGLSIKNMDEYLIRYTVYSGKLSFKRIWRTFYVRNYIIQQYSFPKIYFFHNFAQFVKDILIKVNLYNPKWSIRSFIRTIKDLVSIR
jgi:glycosyltransferase involved in cell wall biosynthesis